MDKLQEYYLELIWVPHNNHMHMNNLMLRLNKLG